MLLGFAAAGFVAAGRPLPALITWWAGRLLDGTDGIYARATGRVSDFGGYLDIVCDMAAYSAMILGFYVFIPDLGFYWMMILCFYVLCITSALSLGYLQEKRIGHAYDSRTLSLSAGLAEGGETGLFYSLLLLWPKVAETLCLGWIVILAITVVARTLMASRMSNYKKV
jgi:phosphatidylglycerophosphate synthase